MLTSLSLVLGFLNSFRDQNGIMITFYTPIIILLFGARYVFCDESFTVMEGASTYFQCKSATKPVWEQKLKDSHVNLAFGAKKFPNFKNDR